MVRPKADVASESRGAGGNYHGKAVSGVERSGEHAILAGLSQSDRDRVMDRCETISHNSREEQYQIDRPIEFVYFPLTGVYSLVIDMQDGGTVEAGTIGNEGMVGMSVFLGADRSPYRAFAQVPGDALRMPAEAFRDEARPESRLHARLMLYNQGLMNQMAYSVCCNRLHSIEERMCRWLLMTQDRVGADQFPLTQEFLAQMLGVRRPSVTVVAGVLQKAGLIAYARGRVFVLNRKGLEEASCECYEVVRREFDRLLGGGDEGANAKRRTKKRGK